MSRFLFYIDNSIINDTPVGWEDFELRIDRDEEKRFIGVAFPLDLTFVGDGYTAIKNYIDANNRTSFVDFKIVEDVGGNLRKVFEGIIKLSEGTDYISRRKWETPIRDQSFSAYILNNWKTEVNLELTETRLGSVITPCASDFLYRVFERSQENYDTLVTGQGYADTSDEDSDRLKYYNAKDALEFILNWLSDNLLTLESSWLDGLDNDKQLALIGGIEAHLRTGAPVVTTIEDLIISLARLYNLYWTVDGTKFILEESSYFENATPAVTLANIDEYESIFDETSLYSEISVGDSKAGNFSTSNNNLQIGSSENYFQPMKVYMNLDGSSNATLDLQPKYLINSSLLFDTWHNLSNWVYRADKYIMTPYDNIEYANEYEAARDRKDYYDWLDQRFTNEVFLVQYNQTTNTIFADSTSDNKSWMSGHVHFNDAVLNRYNLGGDLYKTNDKFNSFRVYNNDEDSGFGFANNNAWTSVNWYNKDGSAFYGVDGGSNIVDDDANVYYKAASTETKKFSVSVRVAGAPSSSGALRNLAPVYDGNNKLEHNDKGMYAINDRKVKYQVIAALPAINAIFISDEPLDNLETGDLVDLTIGGATGNDWFDEMANAGVPGFGTYNITKLHAKVFTLPFNSSMFTDDFFGGTLELSNNSYLSSKTVNGQADINLRLVKYNDGHTTILDQYTETFTEVKENITLTCEKEYTLQAGEEVWAEIKVDTGNADADIDWVYLPLEFRDNKVTRTSHYTTSPESFRGEILNFEHALTPDQRQDLVNNAHKAIALPEGKGWPKSISINLNTGKTSFSLLTNSNYFNADGNS